MLFKINKKSQNIAQRKTIKYRITVLSTSNALLKLFSYAPKAYLEPFQTALTALSC